MFRNGFVFRLIGVVLLLGLIAAGSFMAFKAGEARGITQAPAIATAISKAAESGQVAPVPPMMYGYGHPNPYGYGYGFGYRHHFNPFGAICFSLFFLFFFFGFMKMIFFRRMRHGGHHKHGPWGKGWEDGAPSMFNEWHKRAHNEGGEKPADEGDKKE